jgi:hypothetical protein
MLYLNSCSQTSRQTLQKHVKFLLKEIILSTVIIGCREMRFRLLNKICIPIIIQIEESHDYKFNRVL